MNDFSIFNKIMAPVGLVLSFIMGIWLPVTMMNNLAENNHLSGWVSFIGLELIAVVGSVSCLRIIKNKGQWNK